MNFCINPIIKSPTQIPHVGADLGMRILEFLTKISEMLSGKVQVDEYDIHTVDISTFEDISIYTEACGFEIFGYEESSRIEPTFFLSDDLNVKISMGLSKIEMSPQELCDFITGGINVNYANCMLESLNILNTYPSHDFEQEIKDWKKYLQS